jgi:rhodanese-related sulfurtransferase
MSDNESEKDNFKRSGVFAELPKEKWEGLSHAVEKLTLAPRSIVFRQGDPADCFYIITSGKVRVFMKDRDGLETQLSVLGAGESFGEMALLTGEVRSANVETLEETCFMVLSKEQFERIMKDYPHLSLAFVKQMSGWLLRDEKIIEKEVQQQYQAPRMSWFDFILILGVSFILMFVFNQSNPNGIPLFPKLPDKKSFSMISPVAALEKMKKAEAIVIDAGPANFYEKRHIKGAINMPLALLDIVYMMTFSEEEEKSKKIIVYGGTISKFYDYELANILMLRGHKDVQVLEGGLSAWEKEGYPVEEEAKGKK